MLAAPGPANEADRLEALRAYAILDSAEEHAYDDITRLAAAVCNTPIAAISLLDSERQWFKARVGLGITATPREHAFCAHAINAPEQVLVVSDAALDPRFADNPLVTGEPGIRFYAGAPLVTPQGFGLGVLCVIDRVPRELPPDGIEALQALARQVMVLLELRRTLAEQERRNARLQAQEWELEDYKRQLEAANTVLEAHNVLDELTGVRNRLGFDQVLESELARALRQGIPLSLLLVDVDRFRAYNTANLRSGGDRALRTIAGLLSAHTRPYDLVARFEGEKFAVIMPEATEGGAMRVGERLRRAVEQARWKELPLTVSIGINTSEGETTAADLIKDADEALRQAKAAGRNLVRHVSRYR